MKPQALPLGAMPFVIYHTLRVAAYYEVHNHMAFELGLECVRKVKACFGDAYPGAHDEIDVLVEEHRELVKELVNLHRQNPNDWTPVEERLLSIYPEIAGRSLSQLRFLFCMLLKRGEGYTVDDDGI